MLIKETRKVLFICRFVLISSPFVAFVFISFNFFTPSKSTKPLSGRCNESRKKHKKKQWGQFNLGFKETKDRNWHCIKIIIKEISTSKKCQIFIYYHWTLTSNFQVKLGNLAVNLVIHLRWKIMRIITVKMYIDKIWRS